VALRAGIAVLLLFLAACGGNGEAAAPEPAATEAPAATTAPETAADQPATTGEQQPAPAPAPDPAPLPGLPDWTAGYRAWMKLNASPIPPRESDPHLGTKNVYASREKRRDLYPPGTVIVKEARRPGADFVGLVAGMRKVPGSNPAHNDWVFVEWTRESRDAPFTELARGAVCEACHSGVANQDYVFTTG
jgi:hypothetical protein